MILNDIKPLIMLVWLTIFVGCTYNSQSPRHTSPLPTANPQNSQGTVDSGGGNTFNGKTLESYAINIRELPVFKDRVSPLLESRGLLSLSLKNVFNKIIDQKTWYMIPSELKKLPSEKIASAVGTDQAALQDLKQVWLNQIIFNDMPTQDQSILIIHELLMGLRLLKFDSPLSECLAFRSLDEKDSFCHNSYLPELRGRPSDLTEIDYAQIRAATKKLSHDGLKFLSSDWNDLLGKQGFSTDDHEFTPTASIKIINLFDLGKMIERSKLSQSWPSFGFNFNKFIGENTELLRPGSQIPSMIWKSDQNCNFSIDMTTDTFSISLIENGTKLTYSSIWTSDFESILQKDQFTGQYFYNITTPTLKINQTTKQGDEVLFVNLKFLDTFLQSVYFDKAVCLNSDCSETGSDPKSYKVMCYTIPSLKVNSKK